ncbi:MAG: hypothetical protein COB02_09510 [Candidatus Cloacimonadota bacterium]|nr:MAG: hypothetical protein COB02_09510 [Candidatus Cloacimonadota bacterium]
MSKSFSLNTFLNYFHNYLIEADKIDDPVSYVYFGIIEFIIAKKNISLEILLEDNKNRNFKNETQKKSYLNSRNELVTQSSHFLNVSDLIQSQQVILFLFDELFIKSEQKNEFLEELILLIDFIESELTSYQLDSKNSLMLEIQKSSKEARELNKDLFKLFGTINSEKIDESSDDIVEIAFKLTHSVFYQAHLLSTIKLNSLS